MRDSDIEPAWRVLTRAEALGLTFAIEDGKLAISFPEPEEQWLGLKQEVLRHRLMIAGLVNARAELKRERGNG